MKIKVDRTNTSEGDLVFTITVSDPHQGCFGEEEKKMMNLLDFCKDSLESITSSENKTKEDIISLIHASKEKTFVRILNNLKFSIENDFRIKYKPICQEIYNWIYDHQTDSLKKWMQEFDPQRTTYYFDNDNRYKHEVLNMISDDKIDEDDCDDEDNEDDDE